MAIKISDTEMTSDVTRHTATRAGDGWAVTWLPGRTLTQNEAITAMTVAEMVIERAHILADPSSKLWWHMDGWAAELGVTAAFAVAEASLSPGDLESISAAEAGGDGTNSAPKRHLPRGSGGQPARRQAIAKQAVRPLPRAHSARGLGNPAVYVEDTQGGDAK